MKINIIFVLFGLSASLANAELSGLISALNYLGFNLNSNGTGSSQHQLSRGQCEYTFESFALLRDRYVCVPDDEYILHLNEQPRPRRPPLMIRCLHTDPPAEPVANSTKLLIMNSAKDIVNLLKPIGNATKRHEPGSCVLVHFCTPTSVFCADQAKLINELPYIFPTLPVAYIDAYEFTRFNAEFGIVSLPTLMLFHQGRPLVKYERREKEYLDFPKFVLRHTNIKRVSPRHVPQNIKGPLSSTHVKTTDWYLILAWTFILICLANYMRRTQFWKQLVEMVQRNWRESEETQMEMVD